MSDGEKIEGLTSSQNIGLVGLFFLLPLCQK